MIEAHVITCNDTVQAVVLDDIQRATALLGELRDLNAAKLLKQEGGKQSVFLDSYLARHRWLLTSLPVAK